MTATNTNYKAGKEVFILQLQNLIDKLKALPEPEEGESLKSWLETESWILEQAIYDNAQEAAQERK